MMFIPNTNVQNARSIIATPQGMQLGDSVMPEGDDRPAWRNCNAQR